MFGFLFGILIFFVFVACMIAFPAFRAGVFGIALLVGAAGWYFYEQNQTNERRSLSNIKTGDLSFENVTMKKTYSSFSVDGTVTNNSSFNLRSFKLLVTVQDCPASGCRIVGQDDAHVYVDIPSRQTREFSSFVSFSGLPSQAVNRAWDYRVIEIRSK